MTLEDAPPLGIPSRALLLVAVGISIVVAGLVVYAGWPGARGSDQYWYLADVETLVRSGATTTNSIFPVRLLGPEPALPPPFVHNVLSIYLAALPAAILGSVGGWLTLNTLSTLGAAILIFLAARSVASPGPAILCAALYPILPLTFWYTTQPLAEASSAFFGALTIFALTAAGTRPARWLAVVAAAGLLYFSRESYLPVLLAIPVVYWLWGRDRSVDARRHILAAAVLVATAAGFLVAHAIALSSVNVDFSYSRLLHTAIPGQTSNMWFNFDLSSQNLTDTLPLDLSLLGPKLADNLAKQFVSFESLPFAMFFWTFNVLALVALGMAWRDRHRPRPRVVIMVALGLAAVHLITIALFQNQVRYTLPAIPGLLVVLAIALSDIRPVERAISSRPLVIVLAITLVAVVPTAVLARTVRSDAEAYGLIERETTVLLDRHVPDTEGMFIAYEDTPQVLAYAARPRLIVYLWPGYSSTDLDRLRTAFSASWLLAPTDSAILSQLSIPGTAPVALIDMPAGSWGLYHLDPPDAVALQRGR